VLTEHLTEPGKRGLSQPLHCDGRPPGTGVYWNAGWFKLGIVGDGKSEAAAFGVFRGEREHSRRKEGSQCELEKWGQFCVCVGVLGGRRR
jgi:hypothetical protein